MSVVKSEDKFSSIFIHGEANATTHETTPLSVPLLFKRRLLISGTMLQAQERIFSYLTSMPHPHIQKLALCHIH